MSLIFEITENHHIGINLRENKHREIKRQNLTCSCFVLTFNEKGLFKCDSH